MRIVDLKISQKRFRSFFRYEEKRSQKLHSANKYVVETQSKHSFDGLGYTSMYVCVWIVCYLFNMFFILFCDNH